jgi:hypothetical protein
MTEPLAWGAKVSPAFRSAVRAIAADIGAKPSDLMACSAFETGRTFRADIMNAAGSGAVGLIQFMPSTAAALGTTIEALKAMTPEAQLHFVHAYFKPWSGRLKSLGDVYGAILWPGMIGKPDSYILFDKLDALHARRYLQNKGLDLDRDGHVTRGEVCKRIYAMRDEGLKPGNVFIS